MLHTIANFYPFQYTTPRGMALFWGFLIGCSALLALCAVLYLVHHLKNRGKPPVERKGANLLGGAYGNGAVGGKPTGAGAFGGVPGVSIPVNKAENEPGEDPLKR